MAGTTQHSVLIYALVGILAALAHLTRANGLLLLIVALIVAVIPAKREGETTGRLDFSTTPTISPVAPPLRTTQHATYLTHPASRLVFILLGYFLIMLPWFVHSIQVTGSPLPTVGTQTMFLTTYDDLFAYGRTFDLSSYREWGVGNILRSKVNGVWNGIQTWIAVCVLVFLAPFIGIGRWVRWREGQQDWSRSHDLYTLFLFIAAVVLALAVFATIDSQYAFLVACLGIPGALIWIFRIVVAHQRRPQAAKTLSIFVAFVLFAVGPASCTIQTRLLEKRLEAVIAALESHRSTHGQYPKSLKELRPQVDTACSPRFPRQVHYSTSNGNTEFSLMCVNYRMNKHIRQSRESGKVGTETQRLLTESPDGV